jgi:uncharacterized protein (DUF342 family)
MSDPIRLTIGSDKMSAFLTVIADGEGTPKPDVTFEMAMEHLKKSGVVFGLDENAVHQVLEEEKWGEKIQVASGRKPVKGKDGKVEFYFETEKKLLPKTRDDGSVDYHDLTLVENVSVGQLLAKLTPPTDGEAGEDIYGKVVPAVKGKSIPLIGGKNTSFRDEEKTLLEASVEGFAKLKNNEVVEVDNVFTVDSDVDYETGDIQVNGHVCVRGDVKAGFNVEATGNVEVRGLVEDCSIEAGGDVLIKGGFVGHGNGIIQAGGDAILTFVHNQKIVAEGDIQIAQSAIQSDMTADGSLLMDKGKGVLIGGVARVTHHAIIDVIGNDQYVKTKLIAGNTEGLELRINQLDKDITKNEENLNKVKKKIAGFMELKRKGTWTSEMENAHRKLEKLLVQLPDRNKLLQEQKNFLKSKMEEIRKNSYIRIKKKAYPGVSFKVAGLPRKIEQEWGRSVFKIVDGELIGTLES